jgi:hypothetical protein
MSIKAIYFFYRDGFKNMTVGKTLWKIIFIKLVVILLFLKYVIHNTNFKTEYQTEDAKINFVYENLKLK